MSRRREIGAMYEDYPAKKIFRKSGNSAVKLAFFAVAATAWYLVAKYIVFGLLSMISNGAVNRWKIGLLSSEQLVLFGGMVILLIMVARSNIGK